MWSSPNLQQPRCDMGLGGTERSQAGRGMALRIIYQNSNYVSLGGSRAEPIYAVSGCMSRIWRYRLIARARSWEDDLGKGGCFR